MSDFGSIGLWYGGSRNYRFLPDNLTQNGNVVFRQYTPRAELANLSQNGNVVWRGFTLRKVLPDALFYACPAGGNVEIWKEAAANFSHEFCIWNENSLSGLVKDSNGDPLIGYWLGLFHRPSMHLIAKSQTNVDGHYEFNHLKAAADFFVVCLDSSLTCDAVVHDNLTPGS